LAPPRARPPRGQAGEDEAAHQRLGGDARVQARADVAALLAAPERLGDRIARRRHHLPAQLRQQLGGLLGHQRARQADGKALADRLEMRDDVVARRAGVNRRRRADAAGDDRRREL
jgi:hypothetical protein